MTSTHRTPVITDRAILNAALVLSLGAAVLGQSTQIRGSEILTCDDQSRVLLVPTATRSLQWVALLPTWTSDGAPLPRGLPARLLASSFRPAWRRRLESAGISPPRLIRSGAYAGFSLHANPKALAELLSLLRQQRLPEEFPALAGLEPSQSLACYQAMQDPQRAVQVLLGDFDPARVRKLLPALFAVPEGMARPALPALKPPPAVAPPDGILLQLDGLQISRTRLDLIDALVFQGAQSGLQNALAALRLPGVQIRPRSLGRAGRTQLQYELRLPGSRIQEGHPLLPALKFALDALQRADSLDPIHWQRAAARLQARDAEILMRPDGQALWLARRWARTGHIPGSTAAVRDETAPSPAQLQELCKRLFATANRKITLPR